MVFNRSVCKSRCFNAKKNYIHRKLTKNCCNCYKSHRVQPSLSYYDGRYNNLHVTIQIRVIIVDITTVIMARYKDVNVVKTCSFLKRSWRVLYILT